MDDEPGDTDRTNYPKHEIGRVKLNMSRSKTSPYNCRP